MLRCTAMLPFCGCCYRPAASSRALELGIIIPCGRDIWKCEVVAYWGVKLVSWIRAKHSATLPTSKCKTSDVLIVLVERVADIRSNECRW